MGVVLGLNISTVADFGRIGQNDIFKMAKALEKFDHHLRLEYDLSSKEIVILHSKIYRTDKLQRIITKVIYRAWKPEIRSTLEGDKRISFTCIRYRLQNFRVREE